MIFQFFGSLSLISVGALILDAAAASSPKLALRPLGTWVITPPAVMHSAAATLHRAAAAAISISRAVAPARRRYSWEALIDWLEPVSLFPHTPFRLRFSWGGAYSELTVSQSHSSSAATNIARAVRIPCPISD